MASGGRVGLRRRPGGHRRHGDRLAAPAGGPPARGGVPPGRGCGRRPVRRPDGADGAVDPSGDLTARLGFPVDLMESEPAMAALGAASTPGAAPDAAVLDLGAGTADVVVGRTAETRAGCGALLTLAVAEALGTT